MDFEKIKEEVEEKAAVVEKDVKAGFEKVEEEAKKVEEKVVDEFAKITGKDDKK